MKVDRKTIRRFELAIREGRGSEVVRELAGIHRARTPRDLLPGLASLASRAGAAALGARWLAPFVRPSGRRMMNASDEEKAEYAGCLARLGASAEATSLLLTVDAASTPQALLYQAIVRMNHWDYAQALTLLKRYVASSRLTSYQRLVGQVNMAAVLVYERREAVATFLLRQLIEETGTRRLQLLKGNVLQLSAYHFMLSRQFAASRLNLMQAEACFSRSGTPDAFYNRKWLAIVDFLEKPVSANTLGSLALLRDEARRRQSWETIRDCDRFEFYRTRDRETFLRLYFGTPFAAFRERLVKDTGINPDTTEYEWRLGGNASDSPLVDASAGCVYFPEANEIPGGTLSKTLAVLSSDFYRPFRIPTLFGEIFPGQHYSVTHSPPRVHQSVRLLKNWLEAQNVPLIVESTESGYRLSSTGPCRVRISLAPVSLECEHSGRLYRLRGAFAERSFSVREAGALLGTSYRTAFRVVTEGMRQGAIARLKHGPGVRYAFRAVRRAG